jgi:chemotaxis protein CheX
MTTETLSQIDEVQELAQKAVREVFHTMLSIDVTPHDPLPLPPDSEGEVVSSVGFIGKVTGAVYLYSRVSFARLLTSRMLGIPESEVDSVEMINDALGELSNMVVGSVKSHLCDRGLACTLTIPSIVRGQKLSVEKPAQVTTRVVAFAYGSHHFLAEIFVKDV